MKYVTVFFDFEAWWEAPYRGKFAIESIFTQILDLLDEHKINATFNTCGIVAKFFPELVRDAYSRGHDISCHGFMHENFMQMNASEINDTLQKAEQEIRKAIKHKPSGIRFPWMFYTDLAYKIIEERGYKWASNYHVPFPESFGRPDYSSINYKLAKTFFSLKSSFSVKAPFMKNGLLEIPALSSSDGDLLSLVNPEQDSRKDFLNFAFAAWKSQFLHSGRYFNLNFHPWLIGSKNRLALLRGILKFIDARKRAEKIIFLTAEELAEEFKKQKIQ